jgi:hypothetical protein
LLAALPKQQTGAKLDDRGVQCGKTFGCVIDVFYDSPQNFRAHDAKVREPGAPLAKYPYGTGRTGLLKNPQGGYVAAWFLLTPGLTPDPDDRSNPANQPKFDPSRQFQAPSTGPQPPKVKP